MPAASSRPSSSRAGSVAERPCDPEPEDAVTPRLAVPRVGAALLACGANPWHGETWRDGILRFRVARTFGYGASAQLTRGLLGRLDAAGITGRLRIVSSLDAVLPVSTQGPTF